MNIFPIFLTVFILALPGFAAEAQQTDSLSQQIKREKYLALLMGLSAGSYVYGDIGFARVIDYQTGRHPVTMAWFIADEVRLGNKFLMGPKVGIWIAGGLAMGLNMIYYTDLSGGTLVFRPEIGAGLSRFKFVYGYNARVTNKTFGGINGHMVEFVYGFRLKSGGKISGAVASEP